MYGNDENVQLTFLFFLLYAAKYGMHSLPSNIRHCKNRSIHRSFMMLGTIAFTMSVYIWFDNICFSSFTPSICYLIFMWINSFALFLYLSSFLFFRLAVKCVWFRFLLWVCMRICIQSKCQIETRLMVKGGTLKPNILSASIFRIFTLLTKPIENNL